MDFLQRAHSLFEYTQSLRRDFHQHPELSLQEVRTSRIVAQELKDIGFQHIQTGVAKTGVVALLEGAQPGPVLLLRFDMDALPVTEDTGAAYASQNPGVMHACGHDGHIAIGLTVARMLFDHRESLAGTVKFVFQPAEEGLGGAARMVAGGVLENPRPSFALAVHLWNDNPLGWFGVTPGPVMAAAETLAVKIRGKGGHGAAPHQTHDPVYAASQIVCAVQSITSRNVPPLESAVISVCSIHGGSAFNIIPPVVEMEGTIRTFKKDVRALVLRRFEDIVNGVAGALGCEAEIELQSVTPAVDNDPALTQLMQQVVEDLFPEGALDTQAVTMGSEDMAFMMEDIPGCYIFVGSANAEKGLNAKHHHPKFDFDERAMVNSAAILATAASKLLAS